MLFAIFRTLVDTFQENSSSDLADVQAQQRNHRNNYRWIYRNVLLGGDVTARARARRCGAHVQYDRLDCWISVWCPGIWWRQPYGNSRHPRFSLRSAFPFVFVRLPTRLEYFKFGCVLCVWTLKAFEASRWPHKSSWALEAIFVNVCA